MGNKPMKNQSQNQSDLNSISDDDEKSSLSKFSFIWLNSTTVDSFSTNLLSVIKELQDNVSETLKLFDDEWECYEHIRETVPNDKLIVIVESGNLCNFIVPLIDRLCQVAVIFIYYLTDDDREGSRFDYCKVNETDIFIPSK
jgi:hypothetical protein